MAKAKKLKKAAKVVRRSAKLSDKELNRVRGGLSSLPSGFTGASSNWAKDHSIGSKIFDPIKGP